MNDYYCLLFDIFSFFFRSECRREEVGFQIGLIGCRGKPDRERKRVPNDRSNISNGSLPQGPSVHPRKTEDPSIRGCAKTARRRVVMKRYGGAVPETMWKQVRTILY